MGKTWCLRTDAYRSRRREAESQSALVGSVSAPTDFTKALSRTVWKWTLASHLISLVCIGMYTACSVNFPSLRSHVEPSLFPCSAANSRMTLIICPIAIYSHFGYPKTFVAIPTKTPSLTKNITSNGCGFSKTLIHLPSPEARYTDFRQRDQESAPELGRLMAPPGMAHWRMGRYCPQICSDLP